MFNQVQRGRQSLRAEWQSILTLKELYPIGYQRDCVRRLKILLKDDERYIYMHLQGVPKKTRTLIAPLI